MNSLRALGRLRFTFIILAGIFYCQTIVNALAQFDPGGGPKIETFFGSIEGNDTNTVFKMLDENSNLVHALYYGRLPLHVAAQKGCVSIVARLLQDGADINEQNDSLDTSGHRLTALEISIWYDHPEVCRLLLESGADPNLASYDDGAALHLAFTYNRPEIAGWLLEHGANPFLENPFPYHHETPIDLALDHGQGRLLPQMLKRMAAFGAAKVRTITPPPSFDFNRYPVYPVKGASEIFAERGEDWLFTAAQHGELEAVQALFQAGVTTTNINSRCPTLLQSFALSALDAARSGPSVTNQWHFVQDQLKAYYIPHADPGFVASLRSQEAELAAKVANLAPERWQKILELLVQHGADYDAFAATALGDTNQIARLMSADKNVAQARDCNDETPLHWAVRTDRLPLASFWIQAGVPLAATNSAGQTALHLAAVNGKTEFVKLLLAANTPTTSRDTNGWTPLDAAIQAKQSDSINLLLGDKSAPPHPERGLAINLHEAAATGNIAALVALLDTETNLEARNELGLTPLQVAVTHGHLAAAALLVDKGADLNVRDPDGNTLLHEIFLQDRFFVNDRPPADWLAHLKESPYKEIYITNLTIGQYEQGPNPVLQGTSFLLACGLDAMATNNAGDTVMQLVTEDKLSRGVFFFNDDREQLLKLLRGAGGNLQQRDADGNTVLHRSVTGVDANDTDRLAAIIAAGADVNATNAAGQTPLHIAASKIGGWDMNTPGTNEPFQMLVYLKANVNAQDNEGRTPLHVLAAADTSFKKEATQLLLDAGANPSLRDKHGQTPAHLFLSGAWPWGEASDCIDMLVKAGADLNAKDDQGKTPLHYLAALGSQQPMFFIRGIGNVFTAAKADVNARDNDGNTPLHIAVKTGTTDVFDWLVKQGADLDATNNAGETPRLLSAHHPDEFGRPGPPDAETDIFTAAREGKIEPLAVLIKGDPTLANATNDFGQTPLRIAVQARRTNVVEFLEQHGARWDAVSAVMFGRTNALREILARQPADITVKSYYDSSLLHLAAVNGDVEITKILLDAGGDMQAQDIRGLTPLGLARWRNQPDVAGVLSEHGATENIFDVAYAGGVELAAGLISKDKSLVFATNSSGLSVSEIAAGAGQADVLKFLLDNGASSELSSLHGGRTPLHLAAIYNQTGTALLLIRRGAKLDAYDQQGFTPLHLASLCGAAGVAGELLKNNVDLSQLTTGQPAGSMPGMSMMHGPPLIQAGDSALDLAVIVGQTNLIQLLLSSGAAVNATDGEGRTPLDLSSLAGRGPIMTGEFRILAGMDPLFISESGPFALMKSIQVRRNVTVDLLEKAGGKHLKNPQRNGFSPGFPQGFPQ